MQKLKTILVDDEPKAIQLMEDILSEVPEVEVYGSFTDPVKALLQIRKEVPDLLMLDIQMPGMNGLDMLKIIGDSGISVHVIFVTAFDQFAIDAFHREAFDYLLKPVSVEEVRESVHRLIRRLEKGQNPEPTGKLLSHFTREKIQIPDRTGITYYEPEEILYIEASGNYSLFHTTRGNNMATKQLGYFEEMLAGYGFIRTSRSVLINPRYLTRLNRRDHTCILEWSGNRFELPVSDERMKRLV